MLMSLQGIVAKEKSQIYLYSSSESSDFEQIKTEFGITMVEETDPWALVDRFKTSIKDSGYVSYKTYDSSVDYTDTPNAPESINVAAVIAGQENYLMIDESLVETAKAHGLVQKEDALNYDAASIYAKYKDSLNKEVYASISKEDHALYDVAIALGCMVHRGEYMETVLKDMTPGGIVIGWYDSELVSVKTASKYGYSTLALDHAKNFTVSAGLEHKEVEQVEVQKYANAEDKDVHYVTFIMSDGDNLNYAKAMPNTSSYYGISTRGTIPFGWSLNPSVYEWLPQSASKLYSSMTTNDNFVASVSGYGYMMPNLYPADYLQGFVDKTAQYMQKTDINYITLASNNADAATLDNYVPAFAASEQILGGHFNDMSSRSQCYVHTDFGGGVVWYNDKPFIYDRETLATDWEILGKLGFTKSEVMSRMANRINNVYERDINSIEGYTIINVNPWSANYNDCIELTEMFNDDVVVVTPSEFFELVTKNVPHEDYLDMNGKNMIDESLISKYAPANTSNYNSKHMFVVTENGGKVLEYNPTVAKDNSALFDTASVYGPYNNALSAGKYRVDIEVKLTGNNEESFIVSGDRVFKIAVVPKNSVGTKISVKKDHLVSDIDGDGYYTYSHSFELSEDSENVEYCLYADMCRFGFKIRNIYLYSE